MEALGVRRSVEEATEAMLAEEVLSILFKEVCRIVEQNCDNYISKVANLWLQRHLLGISSRVVPQLAKDVAQDGYAIIEGCTFDSLVPFELGKLCLWIVEELEEKYPDLSRELIWDAVSYWCESAPFEVSVNKILGEAAETANAEYGKRVAEMVAVKLGIMPDEIKVGISDGFIKLSVKKER